MRDIVVREDAALRGYVHQPEILGRINRLSGAPEPIDAVEIGAGLLGLVLIVVGLSLPEGRASSIVTAVGGGVAGAASLIAAGKLLR